MQLYDTRVWVDLLEFMFILEFTRFSCFLVIVEMNKRNYNFENFPLKNFKLNFPDIESSYFTLIGDVCDKRDSPAIFLECTGYQFLFLCLYK